MKKTRYTICAILALLLCAGQISVHAQDVVINEFMAVNNTVLTDQDGEYSDWLELQNISSNAVSLDGWHLTDNGGDLGKWTFPATNIGSGKFILVFASSKNRAVAGQQLHTNFKLTGSGEYLGLVRSDGETVEYAYDPMFPPQVANISYGICTNIFEGFGYFTNATPGLTNKLGYVDLVADTKFEPNRGIYANPIVVAITSLTAGAQIRITTDCELPSVTSSLYVAAIPINNSTVFRAQAYGSDRIPSGVDDHTYIFLNDVLYQPALPANFPATWVEGIPSSPYPMGVTPADYEMDPVIVGDPVFGPMMTDALKALPSVFITTAKGNLFDATYGIYANSMADGEAWERPASLAWIRTNNTTAFELKCGMRIQGGAFRHMSMTKKKSFRVIFKADYGPTKLNYDLFNYGGAVNSFDTLVLRGGANDAWTLWGGVAGQYIVTMFVQDSHLAMGQPSPHSTFAHLYIDGLYWGLYNPVEKPAEGFAEAYFGIPKANCDVMVVNENIEGTRIAWDTLVSMCNAGVSDNTSYQKIQGNNPDRTRNPAYPDYLDIDNYIDYLIVRQWSGDVDWPANNWYAFRNRDSTNSTGFKFPVWDAEAGMEVWGGLFTDRLNTSEGVCGPYWKLRDNAEFRLLYADHAQKHLFNNGALTTNQVIPRYKGLANIIGPAIVAESARWGDQSGIRYTLNHWQAKTNSVITTFLVQRTGVFLQQLRTAGLYPNIMTPVFNKRGGSVTNGFQLTLTASNSIYYTLDSRDPREYGTGSAVGTLYTGPITLSNSVLVRTRAFISASQWSALDEALYFVLEEPCPLRVTELMYNPRLPTDTNLPASEYEFIELQNTGDKAVSLCGLKFANGINFDFTFGTVPRLQPGEYVVIVKNLTAFTNRYPDWADINIAGEFQRYREFPVANLDDGGERVTLVDALGSNIISFTYSDGWDWPLAADGAGHSLVPLTMTNQAGGWLDYGGNWRASAFIDGSPGEADDEPVTDIVLNEIVAHTDYTNGEPWQDSDDWIELYNTTASPMSLTNWYLSDDGDDLKKWAIPGSNIISALSWILFSEVDDFHTATNIGFGLNKAGEQVFLSYLPDTDQDRVADCVKFKGQENGFSFGRYVDGEFYWYALEPTSNSANALPSGRVIISEIMYHPAPTGTNTVADPNHEYVELYNQNKTSVELWNETGTWRIDGGIKYTFPMSTTMGPGTTILLVSFDPETNNVAKTNFLATYDLQYTPVLMGPYDGKLSNEGERIALERPQAPDMPGDSISWVIVDEVIYSAYPPWPTGASGTGLPITRIPGSMSGNNPANWSAIWQPSPGIGPAKMVLTTPEYGREYLVPFSLTVYAEVDSYSVSGTVHDVEFFEGTNSIYVDTNGVPYECVFSRTNNVGSHTFSAVLTDDGGTFTSAVTVISVVGPMSVYNTGVSNITDISAAPNGLFTGEGIDYGTVTLYWGDTDGTSNKGSWAHSEYLGRKYTNGTGGLVVTNIDGLLPNKTYYYRWYATRAQGEKWSGSTANFTTPTYSGWQYSMKITFDGYTGTDTLTNFPALIVLDTNSPVFPYAQCLADGVDIRFSDPAVTDVLSYEIESWNTNGKSYVWVRVPELSDSSDYIIMYWGKAFATDPPQATDGSTWNGNYQAVWHLHDDVADSTSRKTTTIDHDSTNITGMIADARYFDGSNSYIEPFVGTNWYGTNINGLTLSMWVYTSGGHASYAGTPFGSDDGSGSALYMKRWPRDFWAYGAQSGTNYAHKFYTGEWAYLNLVLKNGQGYAWKNDVVQTPFAYTVFTPPVEPLIGYMGGQTTNTCYFMGIIDEVRVAGTARSADWIKAEYKNVLSNSLFMSFEPPPEPPPAPPPDEDADGMSDAWEDSYFGGTNISNGGPAEDWDEDGIDNESEYIAGTCPTSGNSLFMLYIGYTNGKLAVIFPALEPGTNHYGGYERLYSLENNTNLELGAWIGVPDYTNIPGMDQVISYTNTANERVFFRARVRLE